ncbi:hypothetical protein ACFWY9_20110 [Amycolatopsis sp. NPDC059027]|uniref:hypothetical protein n=1 Tax=unclassified Amycolatopsis TaxID=2618356 RepID=UPI00366FBF99
MRRPLSGSGSLAAAAMKPVLLLAFAIAALFVAPAVASAAPAGAGTAQVVSERIASPQGGNTAAAAVFSCNFVSVAPFTVVDFSCRVTSGAIQVYIDCSNGQRVKSSTLRAVGTYPVRLTCTGGRLVNLGALDV